MYWDLSDLRLWDSVKYVPDPGHRWTKIVVTKWDKNCESRTFYWSNRAVLLTYCRTKELRCTNKTRLRTSVTHIYMYGSFLEHTAMALHNLWLWSFLTNFYLLIKTNPKKSFVLGKSERYKNLSCRFVSKSFLEVWR